MASSDDTGVCIAGSSTKGLVEVKLVANFVSISSLVIMNIRSA